jgi:L-ascorbate 6-phosphate lactonase
MIDIYSLAGAGFIIKFDHSVTICIDPYLSNSVKRLFGFKRLTPASISADQLKCDILLISHEHGDHLDIDSFDAIYAGNPGLKIFAPASCDEFLREHTTEYTQIKVGNCNNVEGIDIESLKADHGELRA